MTLLTKKFLDLLNSQIERFRRIAAYSPNRSENSKREHLEIIQLLRNQDLPACEKALKRHLLNVKISTLEVAKLYVVNRSVG